MSVDDALLSGERGTAVGPIRAGGRDVTEFDVRAATFDGVVTVTVQGDVDCATAPRLRATLDGFSGAGRTVLVDLSGTEFMDCAGVGVLVDSHARLRRQGGDLVVGSPSRPVLRVLELTGVLESIALEGADG